MGAGKLADQLNITISEAKDLMEKYFKTFPKIKEVLDKFAEDAKKNEYAYSPLDGRRQSLKNVDWDHGGKASHAKNMAKNQPFQGAGASVMKLALCRIQAEIRKHGYDAKMVNVVHDRFCCA